MRCAGLLAAVWAVPWPINTSFDEGSRYNTLLQISVGQEEIDEVRILAMGADMYEALCEHQENAGSDHQGSVIRDHDGTCAAGMDR